MPICAQPWALEITGYNMIFMAVESVAYFALTLVLEYAVSNPKALMLCKDPDIVDEPVR